MSEPRRRRLPREVREPQMLDAAVAVFSRAGFHAASVEEIAEQAGISKPMVYAYFGPKEDLFVACLRRELSRLVEAVTRRLRADASPEQQLRDGLAAFFRYVVAHQDSWIVLYRHARTYDSPIAEEVDALRQRLVGLVARLLEAAAVRQGATKPPVRDVAALAAALVGAAESLADQLLVAGKHSERAADAMAGRLAAFAWHGFSGLLAGRPGADGATVSPPPDAPSPAGAPAGPSGRSAAATSRPRPAAR